VRLPAYFTQLLAECAGIERKQRRSFMIMKSVVSTGLGICALGLVATTAQAAPAAGLAGAADRDAARSGPIQNVTWYGDGYRYGYRRHYRPYYYGYSYGYDRPYYGYRYRYDRPYYGYRHHYRYRDSRWW
jgi:hypothetical protein